MGKIHRVRRPSKKKSNLYHKGNGFLDSFHFEDSPRKENNVLGDSESGMGSVSFSAPGVSNHSNNAFFFTDSCEVAAESKNLGDDATSKPITQEPDELEAVSSHETEDSSPHETGKDYLMGNVFVAAETHANVDDHGNGSGKFSTAPHEILESGDECHSNDEAFEDLTKKDGSVEEFSNSDVYAEDLVHEIPSTGILSLVVASPDPPSGSDIPSSVPPTYCPVQVVASGQGPLIHYPTMAAPTQARSAPGKSIEIFSDGQPSSMGLALSRKDFPAKNVVEPASGSSCLGKGLILDMESQPSYDQALNAATPENNKKKKIAWRFRRLLHVGFRWAFIAILS